MEVLLLGSVMVLPPLILKLFPDKLSVGFGTVKVKLEPVLVAMILPCALIVGVTP